jgi:hypothetical protein
MNFEDALVQVQNEFLHTRSKESEERLQLLQQAISDVFNRMNQHFEARQFEFSNDVSRSL